MKLTLLRKGLLLVSIPLCFEITIFAVLINLQGQVELEAQRINRNKKINDTVNLIVCDGIVLGDAVQFDSYRSLGKSLRNKVVVETVVDIKRRFQELKGLTQDDPVLLTQVEACESGMTSALQDIKSLKQQVRKAKSFDELPEIIKKTRQGLDQHLHTTLRAGLLELAEKSDLANDDIPSEKIRQKIRVLLQCALGLSALFALVAATMLSKNLVGRLSRLSDNANRLADGKPLLAPLGGTDEVAELDKNFHYAAELIEAAKRMRQEVTAMITHDLKTPLQSVRSYLEMIEHGCFSPLNEKGVKFLSTTQNATEHMVGLIDNVLQLEKLRTGNVRLQVTPIKLKPFLDKCLDSVKLMAEGKATVLVADYDQSSPEYVNGDAFWLEQVLVNVLSNAIKFAPQNSSVTVSAHGVTDKVEIRIADQGPGIPAADKKLIFERFHRVQSTASVAGTGLGLPIAKELIELHQGSIAVESEVGKGSTFVIQLPVSLNVEVV